MENLYRKKKEVFEFANRVPHKKDYLSLCPEQSEKNKTANSDACRQTFSPILHLMFNKQVSYSEPVRRQNEERYKIFAENIRDIIWTMNMDLKFTYMSPAVEQLRGFTPEEAIHLPIEKTMTPQSVIIVQQLFEEESLAGIKMLDQNWSRTLDLEMICKDGSTRWCEVTMSLVRDPESGDMEILGVTHDISARKKHEEELINAACLDALTGLYNRKIFHERLEEKLNYAKRHNTDVVIYFLDLDRFKEANDTFGHETGDKLLKEVAKRLLESSRNTDLVFRFGGDEFVLITSDPIKNQPEILAERILKNVAAPYRIEGNEINYMTVSIGISSFSENGNDAETLIKKADSAMYHAKKKCNTFSFCED